MEIQPPISNMPLIYCKETKDGSELFFIDEEGNTHQLTSENKMINFNIWENKVCPLLKTGIEQAV